MNIDWTYLQQLDVNNAFREFTKQLNDVIGLFAPQKTVNIKSKNVVRNEWTFKGLMKFYKPYYKLDRKCIVYQGHNLLIFVMLIILTFVINYNLLQRQLTMQIYFTPLRMTLRRRSSCLEL